MTPGRAVDVLSRDEIRAFTRTSNAWGVIAVAWSWLVIAASFGVLAWQPHPLVFGGVVVVLGGRQLALAVMMHEAAHGTLFRTRWLNDHVADWLCARPVWSDVARYRKHHLGHHAHTGTDRDPDLVLAPIERMSRASLVRKFTRDLTGISGLRRVFGLLLMDADIIAYDVGGNVRRIRDRSALHHLASLAKNTWRPLVANAALFAIVVAVGHGWLYLAWLVAYLTTYGLFLRIRSLAEHACMQRGPEPFRNTRTTTASWLARATVAPLHVNHHVEHHLLPTVPWQQLPALGKVLSERGAIPESSRATHYVDVLRKVSRDTIAA